MVRQQLLGLRDVLQDEFPSSHVCAINCGYWDRCWGRLEPKLRDTIAYACEKYSVVLGQNPPAQGRNPHSGKPISTFWDDTVNFSGWVVGFFSPGILWLLYDVTLDTKWSNVAVNSQEGLQFGFGEDQGWEDTIIQAAHSLCTRFLSIAGVIRSWNQGLMGECTVIIDNMMNLNLLYKACSLTGNQTFCNVADSHTNKTILNPFRPDYSTYHVVAYSQSWVIVGFVETAQWTGSSVFLDVATRAADLFIERLPEDMIPFWEFDAGLVPGCHPRDTSAAAICHRCLRFTPTVPGERG
ncbi:unnamed protein product [Allacma fusca]|uniref:Uncharacterized protein n=1 Tax=Allacma fusca TaxID=39272 RepID=A0A8J2J0F8_9HEXA|nr:unnamed protein product [Allacma fusca]